MRHVLLAALAAFWAWEYLRMLIELPDWTHPPAVAALCYGAAQLPPHLLDALAAAALVGIAHVMVKAKTTLLPHPRRSPRVPRL